jgi:hypothetical protein
MSHESNTVLPHVVRDRLGLLEKLGGQVDAESNRWLTELSGASSDAALRTIEQARRAIELTVDLALSHQVENHPDLFKMRIIWEGRFARIAEEIAQKQKLLSESSHQHAVKTRAAQAYIGTERLG